MAQKDLRDRLSTPQVSLAIEARNANGTITGTGVDTKGMLGVYVEFAVGTITDGAHTPSLQESADTVNWTNVQPADQIGTLANLATTTPQAVGYIGALRYVRGVVTITGEPATGAVGGIYGCNVILGIGRHEPVMS